MNIMQQNNSVLAASDRIDQQLDVLPELTRGAAQVQAISCELTCLRNQLAALAQRDGGHQSWNTFISQSRTWTQSFVEPFASLKEVADNLDDTNPERCSQESLPSVASASIWYDDSTANWPLDQSSSPSAATSDAATSAFDQNKRCPACLRCLTRQDELTAVEKIMREKLLTIKGNVENNHEDELPNLNTDSKTSLPEDVGREPPIYEDDKILVSDRYLNVLAEKETLLDRSRHGVDVMRAEHAQTCPDHIDAISQKQRRAEHPGADLDTYKHLLSVEEARSAEARRRSASDRYLSTWCLPDENRTGSGQPSAHVVELAGPQVGQNLCSQPRQTVRRAETTLRSPSTFEDWVVPSNEGQLAQSMPRGARTFEDMGVLSMRDENAPGRRLLGRRSTRTSELSDPPKYSLPARMHERLGIASD